MPLLSITFKSAWRLPDLWGILIIETSESQEEKPFSESFSLPKGYYSSLQIKIGEAEGKNWWCVMYPPLCLDASLAKGGYTDAENALVTKKYNVKFKILELISELGRY